VPGDPDGDTSWQPGISDEESKTGSGPRAGARKGVAAERRPGEWNWEHVWEERVKKGISASLSEPVLFGNAGVADDVIRFLSMEDGDIEIVKENLRRTLGLST